MAAPAAHLHTVTLRSQATARSAQVAQGAAQTAKQLRQDASAVSLDPEDAPSPASSVTSSSEDESVSSYDECSTPASSIASPSSRHCLPIYGLAVDYDALPAHPELGEAVRLISAKQYAELADQSGVTLGTPEGVLFPWLHGADQPHTQQAAYFNFPNGQRCPTPRFRGLVTLTADSDRPAPYTQHGRLTSLGSTSFVSSTSIASSLNSSSTDSSSESDQSADTSILDVVPPPLLVSTLQPDDILERGVSRFIKPHLPPNVNLRNYRIQAAKFATIADIAIYSERGSASVDAVALARRVARAQQAVLSERRSRGEVDCLEYRVLLVTDPFSTFERDHAHLVSIDLNGYSRNRIDFFEREREEMRRLTEASEIGTNVFLGNTQDVPNASAEPRQQNPLGFSICVDAHDQAHMAHGEALRAYEMHLARVQTYTDERDGVTKPRRPLDIVGLECISTGQACVSPHAVGAFVENVYNLVIFLRKQAQSPPPTKAKRRSSSSAPPAAGGRRVLIHCQDGYTDSSVLALAYVMHDRACSLPEAYLHLQLTAGRSFFVYPSDREVLERLEMRFERLRRETPSTPDLESPPLPDKSMRRFFGGSRATSPATTPRATPTPATLSLFDKAAQFPWFYDARFDGHFPSRILPFLYLGNLNHAMNALMLKQLGITHVVSIGETALVPPAVPRGGSTKGSPTNSLWFEERMKTIQVLDMRNISDDGIDSIRPHIEESNAFIEDARRSGGKVLVHCRVGVSRSATLTIAYLMKHLEMDLASAYLLCRSRRLNILIQPTLLFMNALQWYEARLNAERHERGEPMVLGHLAWPALAHEVFHLNSRYLSC